MILRKILNSENIPLERALSVTTGENEGTPQFVMDFRFEYQCAREIPVRNIPAGLSMGIFKITKHKLKKQIYLMMTKS